MPNTPSMQTILMNSICYPAMLMSVATHDESVMRKNPDFKANMADVMKHRWRMILRSCNGDDPKMPVYVG